MKPRILSVARLSLPFAMAVAALLNSPSANAGTIWDAGGGATTNINTATNWDSDVVNAINGTTVATFGTGGATATINVAASFTGITINRDAAFTIADGAGALTVGSGGITVTLPTTTARAHIISESSLVLGANQSWSITNNTGAASLSVSSIISGGFGIAKAGTGTLTLSGVNTFTGIASISAGTLRATTSAQALGTGAATLSLGGGTLQLAHTAALNFARNTTVTATSTVTADRTTSSATSLTHTLGTLSIGAQTLNVTRGSNITGAGVGGITFGAVTLTSGSNNFAPAADSLLTVAAVGGATFNLNKSGAGSMTVTGVIGTTTGQVSVTEGLLTLSNTANTFTGVVNVSGTGVIAVPGGGTGDPGALGTGAKVVNLTSGGTIRITSNSNPSSTNQKMFTFGTGGGKFDINNAVTLTLDDNTGATSQLQGSGDLTKIGTGNLALGYSGQVAGGFSAFAGNIFVNAGSLVVGNADALGTIGGTTTVASGAALTVAANATNPLFVAENLTLSGTGITSTGALFHNQAFPTTFTGTVTLAAHTSIGSGSTGMLTVNGGIGGGAFDVTKVGVGNLTLGGTNTYTGITNVSAGGLNLTGSLAANTGLTVAAGASFSMGSGTANPLTTVSALNLGAGTGTANLSFDLGVDTANSDRIITAGAATTANTIALNLLPITAIASATTYDLISAASGLTGATYVLNSGGGGYTYTLNTPTTSLVQITVTPAAGTGNLYWRGVVNNSWAGLSATGANTNWTTDAAGTLNAGYSPTSGNTVIFSSASAAGPAVSTTLNANYAVNDVQFSANPTGITSVTIAQGSPFPGSLTLSPTSSIAGLSVADNAGAVTISAPVVLGAPQTWGAVGTGANGSSLTVSGAISGSGANSLTINNLVTLSVAAGTSSTYSGATTVPNSAILRSGANNSFSANSAVTVSGTGILRLNSFSSTIASLTGDGIVQNNTSGNAILTVGDASSTIFSGTLQNGAGGTLGLTKIGAGILTLSGVSTHTGATTVNNGTLKMGSATALNSLTNLTLAGTSTFDLNGFSVNTGGHTSAATSFITNTSTGGHASTATSLNTPAGLVDALNTTATGVIDGLIMDGGTRKTQITIANSLGNVRFTNGANSFTGGIVLLNSGTGTRLSPGTIVAGTPYGTGPIIIGQTPTDIAGIYFSTATQTLTNPIIFNTALGTDRVGIRSDVAGITLSGKITANLAPATFSSNTNAGALILTGQVSGASGLVLDITSKASSTTAFSVTLNNSGTANDYAGDTVVNFAAATGKSANLNLGAANQIPNGTGTGTVILNTTGTGVGTLNLAGFNETINGLSGSGTVTTVGGTLTLGDNNATASFSGPITTGTVNKMGSGTQTFSGANTFTAMTVTDGLVAFATAPATAGPLGNTTVVNLDGGGLSFTGAGSTPLLRNAAIGTGNGTFNVVSATGILTAAGTDVTSSGGNLIKTGAGTLSLSGSTTLNAGAAGVTVNGGTLQAGFGTAGIGALTVGAVGNMNFTNGVIQTLTLGSSGTVLSLSNGARLGFELDGATNDGLIVPAGGAASLAGTIYLDFNNFGAGVAANTYNLISAPAGSALDTFTYVVVNAPSGFNYVINKTDTLVSLTTSVLSNRYWTDSQVTGSWSTLNAGPLSNFSTDLGGGTNSTSIPVGADTVIFSATTVTGMAIATLLDAPFAIDSLVFNNQPAGIATVSIGSGTGGAASTLTLSPVTATNGIRLASHAGDVTISAPVIAGTAQTWTVDNTALPSSLSLTGDVTFTGAVTKNGAGLLTLSGAANSGAGAFNLAAGTLKLDSNSALGTGVLTVETSTTIDALTSGRTLNNSAYTANGNFTFTGSNNLDLGAGALTLGGDVILTASASTLSVGGGIAETGGTRSLIKNGAGSLVVNGGTSYNGATTVNAGTLTLAGTRSGTGATTLTAGSLYLNGANSGGGSNTLTAGNLNLGNLGALGTGAFAITSGIIDNTTGSDGTLSGVQPTAINGSFIFTGTNSLNLGAGAVTLGATPTITSSGAATSLTIGGNIGATAFGITKDGPGLLTLSGTNGYTGATNVNAGTLNLSGSLTNSLLGNINVIGGSTLNVSGTVTGNPTATQLNYGASATTTVVNVSNNMTLFRTQGASLAGSTAVYNQTAGTVNVTGVANNDLNYVANIGYGYFNLTGGTYDIPTRFNVASNNAAAVGVAYVGGTGTLDLSGGDWTIIGYGGSGALTAGPGGTINRTGNTNLFGIMLNTTGAYGVLNVAGGDVINPATAGALRFGNGNISTTTGFVNLAGGMFTVGANTTLSIGTGSGNFGYFNFGGGTLKAAGTITQFVPTSTATTTFTSTVFGAVTNNNNANTAFNTQIGITSNFTGGLVVDTNNFPVTFTTPLVVAGGFAVTQANIGNMSGLSGNSGYVGAPSVRFSAPGVAGAVPATGYAVISGGSVTGIVITNPGVYAENETPTITLTGGGGTIAPFNTTALTTANGSGGLTKNGLGTLTLNPSAANTFTGATLVSGGRLQLNGLAAGVVSTSGITVNGTGTLGFTAAAASTLDLTGKPMTLSGGTLNFDIGAPGTTDSISVLDFTLGADSAFTFNSIGAIDGTYTLVNSVNDITNSGPYTITGQTIGRVTLTPTINAKTITVTSSVYEGKWALTGGGNWSEGDINMTQDNWLNYKPTITGDAALFGDTITAASTVAVDTSHTVGYIRFDNAFPYTIGANGSSNLSLNNGASNAVITVTSGNHEIAENVALSSNVVLTPSATTTLTMSGVVSGVTRNVTMSGSGTSVLSGPNTYTGTTTVSNGVLTLSGARTGNAGVITSGDTAGQNATLNITNGSYTIGGAGSRFQVGNQVTTAATGTVNQSGGAIIFTTGGDQLLVGQNTFGNTGVYNLSGGSITTFTNAARGVILGVNSNPTPGPTSGGGTFTLSGTGVLNMTAASGGSGNATLQIGRSDAVGNNTTNVFNQTGGTANVGILAMGGAAAGSAGVSSTLNVTGGTFSAESFTLLAAGGANTAVINIGGTAQVTLPIFPTNAKGAGSTADITFDSTTGFLSPLVASATYMPAGTFTNAFLTANGAKFNVPDLKNITIAQVLVDATTPAAAGTLGKNGVGILTLSGANTYTGLTSVNVGSIDLENIDALGTTAAGTTVASGARVTFGTLTTAATVAEAFNIAGTGTATNGALNVGGSKTINLSGANTLSANATVSADGGAAFNFTNANAVTGTNTNLTFQTDGSVASSITGIVDLGTGSLTKTGASTLILSGDNDYSGGTALSAGVIQANHNNALGSEAVVITGTRLSIGSDITIANDITINANTGASGVGLIQALAGTATLTGAITINNATPAGGLLGSTGAAVLDIQGVITSSVNVTQRLGTVKYSGGGTGYSTMTVTGTTVVGAMDGIATTATVTLGGSANSTLDLNGFNQSLAGIIRNANTTTIGNSSLTTDSVLTTTGTSSYSGTIVDSVLSGTRKVGLTVASGALTLTGANTYSGGTTLNQGTLTVDTGGTIGAATNPLSVNNTNTGAGNDSVLNLATAVDTTTGSLSGAIAVPSSGTNTATINVATGRTLTANQTADGTYAGVIAGLGGVTLGASSTNTLTLTGANTYTGATSVSAGTLALVGGSHASPITVSTGASLSFTLGSPTTSTSSFDVTAGTIKISGTPTLPSYTLISSSTGITGTPTLNAPIAGYVLKKVGNTLVLENPYKVWADSTFANTLTQKGLTDDQDNDDLENLLEYAFGTDPTVSFTGSLVYTPGANVDTPGQPIAVNFLPAGPGVDYRAVFARRKDYIAAGLTYTIEFSAGLNVWVPSAATPTLLTSPTSTGDVDAYSVPYPLFIDIGGGVFKKPTFFRVVVTQN